MRIILILTQSAKNESVRILADALHKEKNKQDTILIWEINQIQTARIVDDHLKLVARTHAKGFFSLTLSSIPLKDLGLVIKRTRGPIQDEVLRICRALEGHNINVLNGCNFIEWTHSKIKQYETLKDTKLIPDSLCFETKDIEGLTPDRFLEGADSLSFPVIFKTAKSTRSEGVFYIQSADALKKLIQEFVDSKQHELSDGFLLQRFIQTSPDITLSNFYHINIVNGVAQSAVQFHLRWNPHDTDIKGLDDFKKSDVKPVDLNLFDPAQLQKIVAQCPTSGVIGANVLWSIDEGKFYLFEYNDGPNISLIVSLGKSGATFAHQQCRDFATSIANLCMKTMDLSYQTSMTAKL